MCNLREGFVNLREGFVEAPWRLREAFSKTRSAKASRRLREGFAKAPRAPPFGNDSSDNDKPPYNEYLRGNVSIPAELTIFLVIRYLEATTL